MPEIDEKRLYEILGARLRDAREQHRPRLTQTTLSKALGVERTSISNIEAGKQRPPLHVLYKLCGLLRLDIGDVLPPMEEIEAELQKHGNAKEEEIQVGSKSQFVPPKTSAFIQRQTQPSRHLPDKAAALIEEFMRAHGDQE